MKTLLHHTSEEKLEFNSEFKQAFGLLEESKKNVFIMGKAGTGKSTLLKYFRDTTNKKIAVLAPTGVAAVNVQGQTIHSFCRFKPNITVDAVRRVSKRGEKKKTIYQELDMIIIDEISMVRADLMDCIDKFLRLNAKQWDKPFGGIQMVFIGDLYQLPPVVTGREKEIFNTHYQTPYFFSGQFFTDFQLELVELEHVYRQKDEDFVDILNAIRNNRVNDDQLALLNKRVFDKFKPSKDDFSIYLVPTNAAAETINTERLDQLTGKTSYFEGALAGAFTDGHLPTMVDLEVKPGAQIMMVNNDLGGRWVNGTIGKVLSMKKDDDGHPLIRTKLETGEEVDIAPYQWKLYKFKLVEGQIKTETAGTFTQFPVKLAWAITIHKSQGKTFNKAVIDLGRNVFSSGQTYVALSRCTSLKGMVLKRPVEERHIWTDQHIVDFMTKYQYDRSEQQCSLAEKINILKMASAKKVEVQITYLKASDEKTRRKVLPREVGEMSSKGNVFQGVLAYCPEKKVERAFRIDQILEIKL